MSDEMSCSQIRELLKVELSIIQKHLDEHKWFQHIEDKNMAVNDFIEKYAWLMKEMYCNFSCKKENCELRKTEYKLSDLKKINEKVEAIMKSEIK
jgi:hypothetical protein